MEDWALMFFVSGVNTSEEPPLQIIFTLQIVLEFQFSGNTQDSGILRIAVLGLNHNLPFALAEDTGVKIQAYLVVNGT